MGRCAGDGRPHRRRPRLIEEHRHLPEKLPLAEHAELRSFPADRLELAGVELDRARHTVAVDGAAVELTFVEFGVLRTLMEHPGRVYSRGQLLDAVWGSSDFREPRTVDVHVRHLREKIERDPALPERIHTVRGVGYRFEG